MWLFTLFDLPVDTKAARKRYTQFRKELLRRGFMQLQYSVYARFCESEEAAETHRRWIGMLVPPAGQVRLIAVTDKQFEKMDVFHGKSRVAAENPPTQLLLF